MIEGGIAGTVDLRTRLPFDEPGLIVTANAKATYGDRSDKWNGEFSALISKTFDTPAGRFGLMADYARSHVVTRTESVIMDKIRTYCSAGRSEEHTSELQSLMRISYAVFCLKKKKTNKQKTTKQTMTNKKLQSK